MHMIFSMHLLHAYVTLFRAAAGHRAQVGHYACSLLAVTAFPGLKGARSMLQLC